MAPQARGVILQANLDQVFVACASQAGSRGEHEFLGSSIVADPRGRLLAGPMSGTEEGIELAEIDLADVARATERSELITPRADRRTDVYGVILGDRRL
jgi:predicted amidohydrolase